MPSRFRLAEDKSNPFAYLRDRGNAGEKSVEISVSTTKVRRNNPEDEDHGDDEERDEQKNGEE